MTVETEKKRKYDLLATKLGLEHNCKTKIIPYVMAWDGIVTNYHKNYSREIGIADSVEAYIQANVLKRTLESISFEHRRGHEQSDQALGTLSKPSTETEPASDTAQACAVQTKT